MAVTLSSLKAAEERGEAVAGPRQVGLHLRQRRGPTPEGLWGLRNKTPRGPGQRLNPEGDAAGVKGWRGSCWVARAGRGGSAQGMNA